MITTCSIHVNGSHTEKQWMSQLNAHHDKYIGLRLFFLTRLNNFHQTFHHLCRSVSVVVGAGEHYYNLRHKHVCISRYIMYDDNSECWTAWTSIASQWSKHQRHQSKVTLDVTHEINVTLLKFIMVSCLLILLMFFFNENAAVHNYNTRHAHDYHITMHRTSLLKHTLRIAGPSLW